MQNDQKQDFKCKTIHFFSDSPDKFSFSNQNAWKIFKHLRFCVIRQLKIKNKSMLHSIKWMKWIIHSPSPLPTPKASLGWFYKLHFHRGCGKSRSLAKIKRIFFKRKNQKDFFGSRKTSKYCYIHCIVKDYQLNLVVSEGNITITIKKIEPCL